MSRPARLGVFVVVSILLAAHASHAASLGSSLAARIASPAPDESVSVFLELKDRVDLRGAPGTRAGAEAVIRALRAHAPSSQARVLAFLAAHRLASGARSFWINNSIAVRVPVALVPQLAALPDLERVEEDARVLFEGGASPENGSLDWDLPKIHADQVWKAYGLDGTGIVVGSLDTGFDPNHPALQGKWRGGTNSWKDFVNAQPAPYDDHGHGTHTIGTMVGGDGPGPLQPDVGVAYGARFISGKVLDANNAFSNGSIVVAGAQWMLDPDNNPATADFPDVINCSWLFFQADFAGFHDAVTAWRAAGIVPVFCIGNNGPGSSTTAPPGNYDNTIGVGATDSGDAIASFSSRGPSPVGTAFPADRRKPDLSAPGQFVLSSVPGGGYSYWSGTSMAAPHVAGTVALMLQARPEMSLDEIRSALIGTAVELGTPGYDYDYGYGRLDAYAAVSAAMQPGIHVTAASVLHTVHLSWTPSARPDLLHYEIHRSPAFDDPASPLVATTTDTAFDDPGRFGRFYYRVRAVGSGGVSPFSNEPGITACGVTGPDRYAVDAQAVAPVAADFDGDGILDVAVASNTSIGGVKIGIGDGTGHFGAMTSFASGSRPNGIAVGDFDGDAHLDLAITNNVTAGTVSILLGHGDGTFAAPVAYPASQKPIGIVCADFDQDGVLDLAVANNGLNNVAVLRGNGSNGAGDGTFGAAVLYAVGTRPTAIVTGDFNGDGVFDLAAGESGAARVSVLLGRQTAGRADGTFAAATHYACGSTPLGMTTGDFDGDGVVDLAVTRNLNPGFVAVLAGNGDGTFATGVDHPAGGLPQGVAAADLNGDGIADLCVANGSTAGTVSVLLGTGSAGHGDGDFELPAPLGAGGSPSDVAVADFDGDGSPDLAVTNLSDLQNLDVLHGACASDAGTALAVVTPNGGESWLVSSVHTIEWAKDPGVIAVDIDVSRDGGATWRPVAARQTGSTFAWHVPEPYTPSPTARIRVRDRSVSVEDASDAGFTLGPDARTDVPFDRRLGPGLALALDNPAIGKLRARFRLGAGAPATLEVLDLSGRRITRRALEGLGAGEHALELSGRLRAGVYLVRLIQGDVRITRKTAFLE